MATSRATTTLDKNLKRKPDLKVVLVGEKSVGKTCLLRRYLDRKFIESSTTLGASFLLKLWRSYSVAIWDTAGEERFAGLSSFYCRGAGAAILAFDPTNENSFDALSQRFVPLLDAAQEDCLKVVVGTKFDLVGCGSRKVSKEAAKSLARQLNPTIPVVAYFETSSLTGSNVDETFEFIFNQLLVTSNRNLDENKDSLILSQKSYNKVCNNKVSCCSR